MAAKDYYAKFIQLRDEHFAKLKTDYLAFIKKAKDKAFAHSEFHAGFFREKKLAALQFENEVQFMQAVVQMDKLDKAKGAEKIFNELYKVVAAVSKRETLIYEIASYEAKQKFQLYYDKESMKYTPTEKAPKPDSKPSPLKWKGTSITEFVQLVYALHEAGYIINEEKEKTKLVEQFAKLLNYDVGDYWQTYLSSSVNDTNADYVPQIFEELKKSWNNYRLTQVNKEKEKREKKKIEKS